MDNITSQRLRIFCQAVHHKNFSLTARMMGVSPAYITKHIKALEDDLGTLLFHRSTRHVSLTEQGQEIYPVALQILEDIAQLHNKVAEHKNAPRGLLRISTSFGFGRQIVAPALTEFSQLYPDITVQLEVLDQLVELAQEHYDLDIRIGDLIDPNHIARHLAHNHRVLCASPEYLAQHGRPTKLKDLTTHSCLIVRERDHPVGVWALSKKNTISNVKVSGPLITNNGEIALAWALEGSGIVLRSIWDTQKYLKSGDLEIIMPDYRQTANVWAVYPQRLENSAKIKACVKHLVNYFARQSTFE